MAKVICVFITSDSSQLNLTFLNELNSVITFSAAVVAQALLLIAMYCWTRCGVIGNTNFRYLGRTLIFSRERTDFNT